MAARRFCVFETPLCKHCADFLWKKIAFLPTPHSQQTDGLLRQQNQGGIMRVAAIVAVVAVFMFGLNSAAAPPDPKAVRLWKGKCAACHGADGKADTDQGKKEGVISMATKQWQQSHTDDGIKKTVKEGVKKTDKHGEMDAYDLPPEQLDALVTVIRSFAS
jgi:hypothetical protein